ncbi:hypothetical protein BDY24DRAFT_324601, partial [Mrakia frigida]|uniref:uncharacterized protein n=1 Tax=Mrakia frigida TaxID=29902 RepID=UPI003FCC02C4
EVCNDCYGSLRRGKLPRSSLANGLWTGPVPPELACLTVMEERALSLSRTSLKAIYNLDYGTAPSSERLQRAMKGHWVAWPQYLGALVEHVMELPQSPEDLAEQLQVSLVGPSPYSEKELSDLLQVDPRRIRVAFEWLSTRHEDYAAITWNFRTASRYQSELPSEIFVSRI